MIRKRIIFTVLACMLSIGNLHVYGEEINNLSYVNTNNTVKVEVRNANTNIKNNTIFPWFKIKNTSNRSIKLSDIKLRYFYTDDGNRGEIYTCDWSTVDRGNITSKFVHDVKSNLTKADSYLELGFREGAGYIRPKQTIEVQGRFNCHDWPVYTQNNDFSFTGNDQYSMSKDISVIRNQKVIYGVNPTIEQTKDSENKKSPIHLQVKNEVISEETKDIRINYIIRNVSSSPIDLSQLNIKYFYTNEYYNNQKYECDWTSIGSQNITASFVDLEATRGDDFNYLLKIGFKPSAGYLAPGQKVEIKGRIHTLDWKSYYQPNDYSYTKTTQYIEWNKTPVYYRGKLILGKGPYDDSTKPTEPTITKAKIPEEGDIVLYMVQGDKLKDTDPIHIKYQLKNISKKVLDLSTVKLNYYYTRDNVKSMRYVFGGASIDEKYLDEKYIYSKIYDQKDIFTPYANNPDTYLQLSFSERVDQLKPGEAVTIGGNIVPQGSDYFNQSNDYSYTGSKEYKECKNVFVFAKGKKIWGKGIGDKLAITYPQQNEVMKKSAFTVYWNKIQGVKDYQLSLYDKTDKTTLRMKQINTNYTTLQGYYVQDNHEYELRVYANFKNKKEISDPITIKIKDTIENISLENLKDTYEIKQGEEIKLEGKLYSPLQLDSLEKIIIKHDEKIISEQVIRTLPYDLKNVHVDLNQERFKKLKEIKLELYTNNAKKLIKLGTITVNQELTNENIPETPDIQEYIASIYQCKEGLQIKWQEIENVKAYNFSFILWDGSKEIEIVESINTENNNSYFINYDTLKTKIDLDKGFEYSIILKGNLKDNTEFKQVVNGKVEHIKQLPQGEYKELPIITLKTSHENTLIDTKSISVRYQLKNNTKEDIDLTDLSLGYYFTKDKVDSMTYAVDRFTFDNKFVTAKFEDIKKDSTKEDKGDKCFKVEFKKGTPKLKAGETVEVWCRILSKSDKAFSQKNDYSFTNSTSAKESLKSYIFYNDKLVWGNKIKDEEPKKEVEIIYPTQHAIIPKTDLTIKWNEFEGAKEYKLELLDKTNQILKVFKGLKTTNELLDTEYLTNGHDYTLKVYAIMADDKTEVSSVDFKVKKEIGTITLKKNIDEIELEKLQPFKLEGTLYTLDGAEGVTTLRIKYKNHIVKEIKINALPHYMKDFIIDLKQDIFEDLKKFDLEITALMGNKEIELGTIKVYIK